MKRLCEKLRTSSSSHFQFRLDPALSAVGYELRLFSCTSSILRFLCSIAAGSCRRPTPTSTICVRFFPISSGLSIVRRICRFPPSICRNLEQAYDRRVSLLLPAPYCHSNGWLNMLVGFRDKPNTNLTNLKSSRRRASMRMGSW